MNKTKTVFMRFFCALLLIFSVQTQLGAEKPWSFKYPILFFVAFVSIGTVSYVYQINSFIKTAQNRQNESHHTQPMSRWDILRSFFKRDKEQYFQGEKAPLDPIMTIRDPLTGEVHRWEEHKELS